MIKVIIDMLHAQEWTATKSEVIEIAKGKYELPSNIKDAKAKIKRQWLLRKL